jgi:hypothetical protein
VVVVVVRVDDDETAGGGYVVDRVTLSDATPLSLRYVVVVESVCEPSMPVARRVVVVLNVPGGGGTTAGAGGAAGAGVMIVVVCAIAALAISAIAAVPASKSLVMVFPSVTARTAKASATPHRINAQARFGSQPGATHRGDAAMRDARYRRRRPATRPGSQPSVRCRR